MSGWLFAVGQNLVVIIATSSIALVAGVILGQRARRRNLDIDPRIGGYQVEPPQPEAERMTNTITRLKADLEARDQRIDELSTLLAAERTKPALVAEPASTDDPWLEPKTEVHLEPGALDESSSRLGFDAAMESGTGGPPAPLVDELKGLLEAQAHRLDDLERHLSARIPDDVDDGDRAAVIRPAFGRAEAPEPPFIDQDQERLFEIEAALDDELDLPG